MTKARDLAEKATPQPWERDHGPLKSHRIVHRGKHVTDKVHIATMTGFGKKDDNNAAFLTYAASNIVALEARLKATTDALRTFHTIAEGVNPPRWCMFCRSHVLNPSLEISHKENCILPWAGKMLSDFDAQPVTP